MTIIARLGKGDNTMEKVILKKNGTKVELMRGEEVIAIVDKTNKEGDGTYSYKIPQIPEVTIGLQKFVRTHYVTEEGYELKSGIEHVQTSSGEKTSKPKAKYGWLAYASEEDQILLDQIRERCEKRMAKIAHDKKIEQAKAEYEALLAQRAAMEDEE